MCVKLKGQFHLHRSTEENTAKEEFCDGNWISFLWRKQTSLPIEV